MPDPVGVAIAFGDTTLAASPTWTRLDSTDNLVASYSIDRGRSYELDRTGTGTATIAINDVDVLFDPTNSGSPYFGDIQPLKQAAIALQNPVTSNWLTIFRGFVEDYDYVLDPSQQVMRLEIQLVDAFDILASAEMVADGNWGDDPATATPPATGNVYYAADATGPDTRINHVLDDVGWPAGLRNIFSGNVKVKPVVYSPNTSALDAIFDAADAEWPGVSNVYVSKTGLVSFKGRLARFDPTEPTYEITTWKCGDGDAVAASISDTAQIREFRFQRDKNKIINSASATPNQIADADIPGQLEQDASSIAAYGMRSWSAENLLTDGGLVSGTTDLVETNKFAIYYVENYKAPQTRVSQVTFRSLPPGDARAAALWNLICNIELSDQLQIDTTHPGGGGFNGVMYFVDGIHYEVEPATDDYHDVTLTLDVTPATAYTTNPF